MNPVVLITGASRGIGAACARRFARAGWSAVILYRSRRDLAESLCRELISEGQDAFSVQADISDRAQAFSAVKTVLTRYRRIDALINNAAIAQQKLFTDITEEEWDARFNVNVKGAFNMTQAVLPGMISRRSGAIVNVSSMWGQVGASCEVHYSAAKAALIGMTKALAQEVGPSGVRVNCIAPGVIQTDMNAHLDEETMKDLSDSTPLMRIGTPDEVARAAHFLCTDASSFITGQVLGVNGGFII
ncbi:MAG: 3-oxoacyl-ACP reductase FabG [Clostridia bacterium]|nr:3-oxoacyl-ACP reductase FabG [Clostridia bacterium]